MRGPVDGTTNDTEIGTTSRGAAGTSSAPRDASGPPPLPTTAVRPTGSAFANVVRAELFKIARKRRLYVLAALLWALVPVLALIAGTVVLRVAGDSFLDEGQSVAQAVQEIASPYGIARAELVGPAFVTPSFYIIAVVLIVALLVGEERSHNMWKTTLVLQPSRLAVLAGKSAVAMIALGVLLAGSLIFGALFGAIGTLWLPTTFAGAWGALIGLFALQWAFLAAAVAFATLLVLLVRNNVLALAMVFFLPPLIEGIYTVYRTAVGFQPVNRLNAVFQALRLRETLEDLPRYFFTNNLYLPARSPVGDLLTGLGADDEMMSGIGGLLGAGLTLPHAAAVMAVYLVVFGGLATWVFLRRDVA